MALSLRQLKLRSRNIENIRKITSAMEMISVSKLKPQQKELVALKDYFTGLKRILDALLSAFPEYTHALTQKIPRELAPALCVITSDTGLCGGYNNAIIRAAEEFIRGNAGRPPILVIVGRKGLNHFKKRDIFIKKSFTDIYGRYNASLGREIADIVTGMRAAGECGEVFVLYTYFNSVSRHKPVLEKLIRVEPENNKRRVEYITDPGARSILDKLIPLYIKESVHMSILHAFASEHAARMLAMDEATDNARDVLLETVLFRNKLRQANITREIIEVISSTNALRG